MHLLPARDRRAQAWKNGLGVTWQVAAGPPDTGMDDFDWRLSIAEISQDGPFSTFAGVDRSIAVIAGAGLALTVDGIEEVLGPLQVRRFSGDAVTSCRLVDGTTRDLNLMTQRQRVVGSIEFATVHGALDAAASVVLVLEGHAELVAASEQLSLGQWDAALLSTPPAAGPIAVSVRADRAVVALVQLHNRAAR